MVRRTRGKSLHEEGDLLVTLVYSILAENDDSSREPSVAVEVEESDSTKQCAAGQLENDLAETCSTKSTNQRDHRGATSIVKGVESRSTLTAPSDRLARVHGVRKKRQRPIKARQSKDEHPRDEDAGTTRQKSDREQDGQLTLTAVRHTVPTCEEEAQWATRFVTVGVREGPKAIHQRPPLHNARHELGEQHSESQAEKLVAESVPGQHLKKAAALKAIESALGMDFGTQRARVMTISEMCESVTVASEERPPLTQKTPFVKANERVVEGTLAEFIENAGTWANLQRPSIEDENELSTLTGMHADENLRFRELFESLPTQPPLPILELQTDIEYSRGSHSPLGEESSTDSGYRSSASGPPTPAVEYDTAAPKTLPFSLSEHQACLSQQCSGDKQENANIVGTQNTGSMTPDRSTIHRDPVAGLGVEDYLCEQTNKGCMDPVFDHANAVISSENADPTGPRSKHGHDRARTPLLVESSSLSETFGVPGSETACVANSGEHDATFQDAVLDGGILSADVDAMLEHQDMHSAPLASLYEEDSMNDRETQNDRQEDPHVVLTQKGISGDFIEGTNQTDVHKRLCVPVMQANWASDLVEQKVESPAFSMQQTLHSDRMLQLSRAFLELRIDPAPCASSALDDVRCNDMWAVPADKPISTVGRPEVVPCSQSVVRREQQISPRFVVQALLACIVFIHHMQRVQEIPVKADYQTNGSSTETKPQKCHESGGQDTSDTDVHDIEQVESIATAARHPLPLSPAASPAPLDAGIGAMGQSLSSAELWSSIQRSTKTRRTLLETDTNHVERLYLARRKRPRVDVEQSNMRPASHDVGVKIDAPELRPRTRLVDRRDISSHATRQTRKAENTLPTLELAAGDMEEKQHSAEALTKSPRPKGSKLSASKSNLGCGRPARQHEISGLVPMQNQILTSMPIPPGDKVAVPSGQAPAKLSEAQARERQRRREQKKRRKERLKALKTAAVAVEKQLSSNAMNKNKTRRKEKRRHYLSVS